MFPHMYKVRPGKIQQVREPEMTTDFQRQRGDNWRKNSAQWGSQGYDGNSPSSTGSSCLPNPPAIPAPPPDPQDNLSRKSSLPTKEPERKTSSPVFALQNNSSRESPSKRESSASPPRTRTRARVRGQPNEESTVENSVPVVQENSYPPPGRRSRVRLPDTSSTNQENEISNTQSFRTRSRSRINENSGNNQAPAAEEVTFPPPGRMRSRSRQNEEISSIVNNSEETYPPPGRTRSRTRGAHVNTIDSGKDVEVSYSLPIRTRSRTRAAEETTNSPSTSATSSPVLSRTRSRSRQNEEIQNDVSSVVNFLPPRARSSSRTYENEVSAETQDPTVKENPQNGLLDIITNKEDEKVRNGQVASSVPTVTIRIRRRPKVEESEQVPNSQSGSTPDGTPVPRRRIRSQESENEENKTEETPSFLVRRRTRTRQPEIYTKNEIVNGENNSELHKNSADIQKNDNEKCHEKEVSEDSKQLQSIEDSKENEITLEETENLFEKSSAKVIENIKPVQDEQNSPNVSRKASITKEDSGTETPGQESLVPKRHFDSEEKGSNANIDQSVPRENEDDTFLSSFKEERKSPEKGAQERRLSFTVKAEESDEINQSNKNLTPSPQNRRRSSDSNDFGKTLNQFSEEERKRFAKSPSPYAEQFLKHKESMDNDEPQSHTNESFSNDDLPLRSQKTSEPVHIMVEPSTPVDVTNRTIAEGIVDALEYPETINTKDKSLSRENSPRRSFWDQSPDRGSEVTDQETRKLEPREKSRSREPSPRTEKSVSREVSPRREKSVIKEASPRREMSVSREASPRREKSVSREASPRMEKSVSRETSPRMEKSVSRETSPRMENALSREASPRRIIRDRSSDKSPLPWFYDNEREKSSPCKDGSFKSTEDESVVKDLPNGCGDEEESVTVKVRPRSPLNKQLANDTTEYSKYNEMDKENEEENEKEEEDEEEDSMAKATRMWLMSQNQNSEILDKVLPDIEDESNKYKITATAEEEGHWWETPDQEEDKQMEDVKPKVIEEWNEEFNEEPKNFTTFASIKLKSRPPKSPPIKEKKSRKHYSKDDSTSVPPAPPPPPPPPPPPGSNKHKYGVPAPPPPPPPVKLSDKEKKVKKAREQMVDKIKKAARQRPDWKSVMKDIEFFYESEKPVVQSQLLGEIQRGVKLRHVKTNDRSKPDFNKLGLRKLRRQMTVEEKKALEAHAPDLLPSSSDEEEDIDQMRDDLASTKTQLTEEIKKNKKMETEHKILKIDLQSLGAEVKKLKRKLKEAGIHEIKPLTNGEAEALGPKLSKSMSRLRMMEEEMDFSELDNIEEDIQLLNDQIEAQKKRAEKSELKCDELGQKLQVSQNAADEWEMRSVYFEKKYKSLQKDQGIELPDIDCSGTQTDPIDFGTAKSDSFSGLNAKKSSSRKSFTNSFSRMQSFKEEDESDDESSSSSEEDTLSDHQGDDEDEENDSDENEDEEMKENCIEDMEKREEREFIMWKNRLSHVRDKVKNVRKERNNLRDRVKKFYKDMRKEREEYLKLKGELRELSDQMKETEEVVEEEDEDEDEEEEEEPNTPQDDEAPNWWCDEQPQKPKKLKKRKKKSKNNEDEEDIIEDMSGLEDPQYSDSDEEESASEEEEDDTTNRIKSLKETTRTLEENMTAKKKETYMLKTQIDRCEEMLAEEKRRHERLESELSMLLSDI